MLDNNYRYLQIAFNYDISMVYKVLPKVVRSNQIIIEAGTPFIKREGFRGIATICKLWKGHVIADLKTTDGAIGEVDMVRHAGATGATVMGNSPIETLDLFINRCAELNMISMIDMLGVDDPLQVMRPLKQKPDVVIIHRGRDEESNPVKMIRYRHINRVRSKYDVMISAAGGVDLKEARSAVFNGANIVVANLVLPKDTWNGIKITEDIKTVSQQFLDTIS